MRPPCCYRRWAWRCPLGGVQPVHGRGQCRHPNLNAATDPRSLATQASDIEVEAKIGAQLLDNVLLVGIVSTDDRKEAFVHDAFSVPGVAAVHPTSRSSRRAPTDRQLA